MNLKKLITLLLVTLLILVTVTGCKKSAEDTSSITSESSNATYGNVDIVDDSKTTSDETPSTDNNDSQVESGDATSDATNNSSTASDPNKNVNPDGVEIYGSGTSSDPYIDTPNADTHTVKTMSIPAGRSVYYNIYRAGGRILTINNANAYVVCDGTKYTAKNGVVSFKVIDALASDAVSFEIGNTGSADANFTITFADVEGSMANPTIVKSSGNEITLKLEEGNEVGHFYKYNAEKNGTLKLYLVGDTSIADKAILLATNNRNSAQRSTESSEEGEVKSDDFGTYIELDVEKGDEIVINVGSKPNKRGKYPAVEIKWTIKY